MGIASCPICGRDGMKYEGQRDLYSCKCRVCGTYFLTGTAKAELSSSDRILLLPSWIRFENIFFSRFPKIDSEFLRDIDSVVVQPSVTDRIEYLLEALCLSSTPGAWLNADESYVPLAWTGDSNEFSFLLDALQSSDFVQIQEASGIRRLQVSPAGWMRADVARRSSRGRRVFVAMSFSPDMDGAWNSGIRPAIADAGYEAVRVDQEPHNEHIDLRIVAEIRRSRFVVADFTGQRNGVYYEAGFARGLGLDVIWTVRADNVDGLHFDTRQFGHIVWRTPNELRDLLLSAIIAIVGQRAAQFRAS